MSQSKVRFGEESPRTWHILFVLVLSACSVGPEYTPPDLKSVVRPPWAAESATSETTRLSAEAATVAGWWHAFGDETLPHLIERLCTQNLSLAEARQRVVAAQATRDSAASGWFPAVDGTADAGYAGTGEDAVNFRGPPPGKETDIYSAGIAASWEVDLWGRIGHLTHAADAAIGIALEDYHAAAVSLAAELAITYFELRVLAARLAVLEQNIELQKRALAIAESELDAGTGTRLSVAQATLALRQTIALRPGLNEAITRAENRLSVLLGQRPIAGFDFASGLPSMPRVIGLGLPADLLERRADVRRANASYRSAVELIGAAEAERYPEIRISGTFQLQTPDIADLFSAGAATYTIGPSLRVPLVDGGRIDANVRTRTAEAAERRLALERILIGAIAEVESAAVGVVRSEERERELETAADAAKEAAALAESLYRSGLAGFLEVVDAERALVSIEDAVLVAKGDALAETVRLYRALGGSWATLPLPEPRPLDPFEDQDGDEDALAESGR